MSPNQPSEEQQASRRELNSPRSRKTPVVELVALLAICTLIALLALPIFIAGRVPPVRNPCLENLKRISIGLENYAKQHGHSPPAYTTGAEGNRLHSWRTLILPHMEMQALYKTINLRKPWNDPSNARAASAILECYQCPRVDFGDGQSPLTTYLAVVGPDSVIRTTDSRTPKEVEQVAGHTLLVIDAPKQHAVHWMSPEDVDEATALSIFAGDEPRTQHPSNLFLAMFADGRGAAIPKGVAPNSLRAMMTVSADDDDAIDK
ncbi:DUF1559 domain-containing protein [Lacipirellula sp.]|uniref:DUF1559 family PulG-like putative transporter n=1 Tax=Lacipirellula sp. TaxID=2691419 RepID=UPI003D13A82F